MKEKTWKGPGVFEGLSTNHAYKGKSIIVQIDQDFFMETDLENPWPTDERNGFTEPGVPESRFFKHNLRIQYPEEAEDDFKPFVKAGV